MQKEQNPGVADGVLIFWAGQNRLIWLAVNCDTQEGSVWPAYILSLQMSDNHELMI